MNPVAGLASFGAPNPIARLTLECNVVKTIDFSITRIQHGRSGAFVDVDLSRVTVSLRLVAMTVV